MPTIVGEIKRFFRDTTWSVRVPRRLQELRVELAKAKGQLALELDRDPTVAELAEHTGLSEDEVIDGLIAGERLQQRLPGPALRQGRRQRRLHEPVSVHRSNRPGHGTRGKPRVPGTAAGGAGGSGAADPGDALRA